MLEAHEWLEVDVAMDARAKPGALWPYSSVPEPWHADEDSKDREGRYLVHRWIVSAGYHRPSSNHYLLRIAKMCLPYWPWYEGFWVLMAENGRIMGRWTCQWLGGVPLPQMAKPPTEWAQKRIAEEI